MLGKLLCFILRRIRQHEQQTSKQKKEPLAEQGAVPAYLLDREQQTRSKVLSNTVKQKRKEKTVRILLYHLLVVSGLIIGQVECSNT